MVGLIIAFPTLVSSGLTKKRRSMPTGVPADAEAAARVRAFGCWPSGLWCAGCRGKEDPMEGPDGVVEERSAEEETLTPRQKPARKKPALAGFCTNSSTARHSFWACMKSSRAASMKRNHRLASRR